MDKHDSDQLELLIARLLLAGLRACLTAPPARPHGAGRAARPPRIRRRADAPPPPPRARNAAPSRPPAEPAPAPPPFAFCPERPTTAALVRYYVLGLLAEGDRDHAELVAAIAARLAAADPARARLSSLVSHALDVARSRGWARTVATRRAAGGRLLAVAALTEAGRRQLANGPPGAVPPRR